MAPFSLAFSASSAWLGVTIGRLPGRQGGFQPTHCSQHSLCRLARSAVVEAAYAGNWLQNMYPTVQSNFHDLRGYPQVTSIDPAPRQSKCEPDFAAMFSAVPSACMVMSPDFTIVAVSDAHLLATGAKRERIVGRNIFDAFPDNPDEPGATGVANVRASILRVLQNKSPDVMPVQRYDVPTEGVLGGDFTERYWKPIHTPVFDGNGKVKYVMQYVEDITLQVRDTAHAAEMRSEIFAQAEQIRDQQHIAELFQQAPAFLVLLAGPTIASSSSTKAI